MRNPELAAVLSLLFPGVGQLYNGRIVRGILWLIITPGFWLGTGGLLGWVCHLTPPTLLINMRVIILRAEMRCWESSISPGR